MPNRLMAALLAGALLVPSAVLAQPATPEPPRFTQGSLNVFRRFDTADRARMIEFYEKVLGLKALQPINLTPTFQMILFGVGTGQIKLATGLKEGRTVHLGGINDATGIRVFTLTYPDQAALSARFTAAGYPAPTFGDIGGGRRAAMVRDPGGFTLKLVIDPAAPPAANAGVEVGINVSDLERSRAFYREFVGLEELPPVKDEVLGVTKHSFRHGETTLSLWSTGRKLPADTGSAGIQYVIGNVDAVAARGTAQKVAVEEPLSTVPGFTLRTVWLNDPDGVTNYFAQVGARPAAAPAPAN